MRSGVHNTDLWSSFREDHKKSERLRENSTTSVRSAEHPFSQSERLVGFGLWGKGKGKGRKELGDGGKRMNRKKKKKDDKVRVAHEV